MAHRPARCALASCATRGASRASLCAPSRCCARARPQRLVIAPQDIRTSDPTVADDIYAGYFAFASRIVRRARLLAVRHRAAERGLGGGSSRFWLAAASARRQTGAGARERPRARATSFWRCTPARAASGAWRADVAARRTMSWISQSPLLLEGADSDFYRLFMRSIGRHVAFLKGELRGGLRGAGAPLRRHRAGAGDALLGRLRGACASARTAGSTRS